ncbi:MerR family transcriptional regulator [Candidatus Saccharibacteria bacterium]|nr:MerR family transcriptional regulator [Candidatus Saccharibacteria bacterium]
MRGFKSLTLRQNMLKNLITINEFAKLSGVEPSTLRYWDEIGLFSPSRRDAVNNYRYYTPDQIMAVNFITVLSGLEVPLKDIDRAEAGRTPDSILELMERQDELLNLEMRRLQERQAIIHTRQKLINRGKKMAEAADRGEVAVMEMAEMRFVRGERNEYMNAEGRESFHRLFAKFCKQAEAMRINLGFTVGGVHDDWWSFVKEPGQPDYFMSVDPAGNQKQEAGDYLVGLGRGYYGELEDVKERMERYAAKHGVKTKGMVYTLYLHDEICMKDKEKYLVQVAVKTA